MKRSLRHLGTAITLLVAFAYQGTWALASTTGGLSGTVLDADNNAPIAGAQVTAVSPSQSVTATTDAAGRFTFLTLAPDTYTVTASKGGYQSVSVPGQVVFADSVQNVSVRMLRTLRTIAHVTSAAGGALVKSGTTADVYSINATTQQATAALGGGGLINQAYSAISTVPGAYVIPNQSGYYATINIRGGDYDQVGYEFDGVPVNRSFDNYASSSASSLGNAEVQVYTGASPANSEGQGLSGFINQVIKTGTYPGFATGSLGIGTPAFYHRASVEVGGSTPDRLFSYYFGIAGSNQAYNYVNNNNGSEYDNWLGPPLGIVGGGEFGPGGPFAPGTSLFFGNPGDAYFPLGPAGNYSNFSTIYARNVVANFHIGIPHHNDAGRDDVQILYTDEALKNQFYISGNDVASPFCSSGAPAMSGVACMNLINGDTAASLGAPVAFGTQLPVTYLNTYTWGCASAVGKTFSPTSLNAMTSCVRPYTFPNGTDTGSPSNPNVIPAGDRDNSYNDTAIFKLQYTKNFGSSAYLRIYGYSFYSDWFLNGAYSTSFCNFVCPVSPDYELNTHTRGISAEFQDQINEQNLLSIQGSFTTAGIVRDNNGFYTLASAGNQAVVVNSKDPYGGYCFAPPETNGASPVVSCQGTTVPLGPNYNVLPFSGPHYHETCPVPGKPQYGSTCTYLVAENGLDGTYSGTTPNFSSASITDQYRPTDKWLLNAGVRLDDFNFVGQNTLVPPLGGSANARAFWFAAYNLDNCIINSSGAPEANPNPGAACPAGSHAANLVNAPSQTFTYPIWQPRLSGTYTADPNNVIRFSFGRYTEAPNTAFEQYNTRQEDLADYIGSHFLAFGRNTPGYPIRPPTSMNYDLSLEHHFKGSDLSFKVTPFLRQTQDQIQQFFLNPIQGFVSGLNVGSQRSQGVEFQMQKGDFSRNGISGLLSFAYTNSYIRYGPIAAGASGTTVLGPINNSIAQYNAYTKYCANHPGGANTMCGGSTTNNMAANACYTGKGVPVAASPSGGCPVGDIANPYWNAAPQALVDTAQAFPTFDTFPGALGEAAQGFGSPYVSTLVLNYRRNKFAITPSLQFQGGGKYGEPIANAGIDPASGCGAPLVGSRYNAATCPGVVFIPDPYTGAYDGIGAFTQPNELIANLQLTFDVTPRIQLVGILTNLVNYCWGGTQTPWTFNDGNICSYGNVAGTIYPVAPYGTPGADVNPPGYPGSIIQSFRKYPYEPTFGPALVSAENVSTKEPLQFYLTANVRL
ncbi:MAG: TonB-dependent receptor [Candidatus Eremiobacteraeota bacterium]|nr:TonB-dependent receptor [Candidatus Eremiobacteraeota bacterium]